MPEDRSVVKGKPIVIPQNKRTKTIDTGKVFRDSRSMHLQNWGILDALLPIILYHRDGCVLEIGIGQSTFFMCKHGQDFHRDVYTIDLNSEKIKQYNYNSYFDGHKVIWGDSREVVKTFDVPIAVLLIDGYHAYEFARHEFDNLWPHVVEGGVVFIHDTYPPSEDFLKKNACGDVWKLRQELEKRDDMDCFTWPYSANWMGLTMCIRKEKKRPFWGK
jgi:hypothetical protein